MPVTVEHRRTGELFTAWRDDECSAEGELIWVDDPSDPGYAPLKNYRIVI